MHKWVWIWQVHQLRLSQQQPLSKLHPVINQNDNQSMSTIAAPESKVALDDVWAVWVRTVSMWRLLTWVRQLIGWAWSHFCLIQHVPLLYYIVQIWLFTCQWLNKIAAKSLIGIKVQDLQCGQLLSLSRTHLMVLSAEPDTHTHTHTALLTHTHTCTADTHTWWSCLQNQTHRHPLAC